MFLVLKPEILQVLHQILINQKCMRIQVSTAAVVAAPVVVVAFVSIVVLVEAVTVGYLAASFL